MEEVYILDQTFENADFSQIQRGEYEHCIFRNCNLEYADLSGFSFNNCEFTGCNLSMAKLCRTAFREVIFKECKMFGLHFNECNEFGMSFRFDGCYLNNSVFYKQALKRHYLKIQN
ncbi:pentapeptide repeat-containing protein [Chryseobacterium nepalense]|uniref:Pentapeptide repeat-containing protein n=1 Tax=Chryseobacterium nepalense TaxID=1854498 RepID=A0ABY4K1X1_9FLAO|nr:pentapeptide repeat-containing protein [Chryseobacterium nepalense]UPQ74795.1 pentapeptide repeat-containing protein [Chryseobacterium nepalense]